MVRSLDFSAGSVGSDPVSDGENEWMSFSICAMRLTGNQGEVCLSLKLTVLSSNTRRDPEQAKWCGKNGWMTCLTLLRHCFMHYKDQLFFLFMKSVWTSKRIKMTEHFNWIIILLEMICVWLREQWVCSNKVLLKAAAVKKPLMSGMKNPPKAHSHQ